MGIDDFIEDDNTSSSNDSTDSSNPAKQDTDDAYKAYADLDDELNPKVAEIVDEVIQQWNDDRSVDAHIHHDYVRVRRGDLVYGIVNIAKRTQMYFDGDK